MAEVKVAPSRGSLAKFQELLAAYRAYEVARLKGLALHEGKETRYKENPTEFFEKVLRQTAHEEIMLQNLERHVCEWLRSVLKA
jgi:hypothetical protein